MKSAARWVTSSTDCDLVSLRVLTTGNRIEQRGGWVLALALDWLSSRANNVKGGRRSPSTRTVEPEAPAGG